MSYIISHYGENCIVVFYGYPEEPTTKGIEQQRRTTRRTSATIHPQENSVTTCTQAEVLGNRNNKVSLINALVARCVKFNVKVCQAEADADISIVNVALENANCGVPVVVGQDTDLLILLTILEKGKYDMWFLRPASGNKKQKTIFNINRQQLLFGKKYVMYCCLCIHQLVVTQPRLYIGKVNFRQCVFSKKIKI